MKTGMVIVNYNTAEDTIELIDSVINYSIIDKIVVVDNNSKDDSVKKIGKIKNKKVHLIANKENKGYSAGLNIGIKYLTCEYKECNIIVSNADIVIDKEEDIKELLSLFSKDIVVVAPTILEHGSLNRGWKIPSPWQEVGQNIPKLHRRLKKKTFDYSDSHYKDSYSYVEAVSGCFFIINSKHLENIGYFDENVFLYYEENILGVKTKEANKKIVVSNKVRVIHNHSISVDKSMKRLNKYKELKKSQYYFEKNYNKANLIEIIFLKLSVFLGKIFFSIYYRFH